MAIASASMYSGLYRQMPAVCGHGDCLPLSDISFIVPVNVTCHFSDVMCG